MGALESHRLSKLSTKHQCSVCTVHFDWLKFWKTSAPKKLTFKQINLQNSGKGIAFVSSKPNQDLDYLKKDFSLSSMYLVKFWLSISFQRMTIDQLTRLWSFKSGDTKSVRFSYKNEGGALYLIFLVIIIVIVTVIVLLQCLSCSFGQN